MLQLQLLLLVVVTILDSDYRKIFNNNLCTLLSQNEMKGEYDDPFNRKRYVRYNVLILLGPGKLVHLISYHLLILNEKSEQRQK